jgi:hypothetical protein
MDIQLVPVVEKDAGDSYKIFVEDIKRNDIPNSDFDVTSVGNILSVVHSDPASGGLVSKGALLPMAQFRTVLNTQALHAARVKSVCLQLQFVQSKYV